MEPLSMATTDHHLIEAVNSLHEDMQIELYF